MNTESFEIKAYPEMWKDLGMDVERFDKMRLMLGEIYCKTYLTQVNQGTQYCLSPDFSKGLLSPLMTENRNCALWYHYKGK